MKWDNNCGYVDFCKLKNYGERIPYYAFSCDVGNSKKINPYLPYDI